MGLGDLRCCTVASGNFEKQYPEMEGKEQSIPKVKAEISLFVYVLSR